MTDGPVVWTPGDLADELESGRWKQGKARLHHSLVHETHCCIGVMWELAGVRKPMGLYQPQDLKPDVAERFEQMFPWTGANFEPDGLGSTYVDGPDGSTYNKLVALNDGDDSGCYASVVAHLRALDDSEPTELGEV